MSIPTADEILREQSIIVSDIMAQLAGQYTAERVRVALLLAYNRGWTAGSADTAAILHPPEVAHG